ncbi:hypothetical protein MMC27_006421 [Xylographa pallens]|nr:hypothetical protein [Xylographa pallens]
MQTLEWIADEGPPAQSGKVSDDVESDSGLAFILVDPTVQVKDRPYQRHVRSHVMKDFQRRKEAQKGQSKQARGSNLRRQLPKAAKQLQGAVGPEGPPYQANLPSNLLPSNAQALHSYTSHDVYELSGAQSSAISPHPIQSQAWSQPMSLLDAGMVDPFDCLPVTLDRVRYGLINYWIFEMAPTFAPYNELVADTIGQDVLSYAMTDEALTHSFLATFALYRGDLLRQGHDDNSYVRERASAITLINSRLENLHLAVADTTITTVAVLAANEQVSGNLAEAIVHSNGLRRMISLRGGLGALGDNPVLKTLVNWVLPTTEPQLAQSAERPRLLSENGCTDTVEDHVPEFETIISDFEPSITLPERGHSSLRTISGHLSSNCYHASGTGFTEISDECDLDAGDLRLLETLRFLTITTESFLLLPNSGTVDVAYFSGLWSSIAKRLLDWTIPNAIDPIAVLQHHYQRTCRLATLIYADLMIIKFQLPDNLLSDIRNNPNQHTQRLLNRTLNRSRLYETQLQPIGKLLFWCFFLDGLKAKLEQETGTSWLAPGIKAFCAVLTLHTWSEVRNVLELFLWSRAKLDEDGEAFWNKVMAMQD